MRELVRFFPDVQTLLAATPQELGARMLFILGERKRSGHGGNAGFNRGALVVELAEADHEVQAFVAGRGEQAIGAVAEAWAWLENNGFLVPSPGTNGDHGWRFLTRSADQFEDASALPSLPPVRVLSREGLRPSIAAVAWMPFVRGDYETAVFNAMRQVEIELRAAAGLGGDLPAVRVARTAFHSDDGMLTDPNAEPSEREAMAHLFVGVMGVLKNPHSHRSVDIESPADAAAQIMFASYLCGVIERRTVAFMLS